MKKQFLLRAGCSVLALAMALSFSGCNNANTESDETSVIEIWEDGDITSSSGEGGSATTSGGVISGTISGNKNTGNSTNSGSGNTGSGSGNPASGSGNGTSGSGNGTSGSGNTASGSGNTNSGSGNGGTSSTVKVDGSEGEKLQPIGNPYGSIPGSVKGTTVKFATWITHDTNVETKDVLKGFTKKTGIKIEIVNVPQGTYMSKMVSLIAAGNSPDVFVDNSEFPVSLKIAQPVNNYVNLKDSVWSKAISHCDNVFCYHWGKS